MQTEHLAPRTRILELLQRNREATVSEFVDFLELAPVTVRHHLHRLERDGLVTYRERRRKVGRPDYLFYLTAAGHEAGPKGYHHLALTLLKAARDIGPEDLAEKRDISLLEILLQRAAEDQAETIGDQVRGPDLGSRVESLMVALNEENFVAEASPIVGGYQLRSYACPYLAVALDFPSLCRLDQHLFEKVLRTHVTRKQCVATGDECCIYEISESDST